MDCSSAKSNEPCNQGLTASSVDSPPGPVSVRIPFRDAHEAAELFRRGVLLGRQARKGPGPTPIAHAPGTKTARW